MNNQIQSVTKINMKKFITPSILILRVQFANHAIPKYSDLLGILAFKVFS
jgi:hypothetical protein